MEDNVNLNDHDFVYPRKPVNLIAFTNMAIRISTYWSASLLLLVSCTAH